MIDHLRPANFFKLTGFFILQAHTMNDTKIATPEPN